MALPPIWKVRREILRVVGQIKVAFMRMGPARTHIEYHGLSVPLRRTGMSSEIVMAIARNGYEEPEIRGLRRAVHPGDRVLELGSGLGIVTALAARAAAPGGHVLSFEANPGMIPETRAFLTEHALSNVELRHAVLVPKAEPGETRDFHLATSFAVSSLLEGRKDREQEVISVPAEQINDVVAAFRPDVLICDIEGAEAELIPALDASGLRAAVIELHPDRLDASELAAVDAALARHGLHPAVPGPGGTVTLYLRQPP